MKTRTRYIITGSALLFTLGILYFVWMDKQNKNSATPKKTAENKVGAVYDDLRILYPPDEAEFPPEFPAPEFRWEITGSATAVNAQSPSGNVQPRESPTPAATTHWKVSVVLPDSNLDVPGIVNGPRWRPEAEVWSEMKLAARGGEVTVVIKEAPGSGRKNAGRKLRRGAVRFRVSTDEVGAPIFFRDVPLPFIYAVRNPDTIRWRLADVSSDKPGTVVLENLPVCGNCHSFSLDGKVIGMDVDYANDKGSYALAPVSDRIVLGAENIITWSDYRRGDGRLTFGLLSRVSPDGRYAISTVKDRSIFVPRDDLAYSQLFFPVRGILACYDRETGEFHSLPGADSTDYVQSNPAWSPDGKYIYFARAVAGKLHETEASRGVLITSHLAQDFLAGREDFRFDIYRVPFNGGRGGKPEAVVGASDNGFSNFFPKISPDGKWLVFCRAKNFMLLQPDSELYIQPTNAEAKAEAAPEEWPRKMNCNHPGKMNSWHSWSPDSRWLVFSSKEDGAYTRLYLTHVDEKGVDSPAILLEHIQPPDRACNIPEFINIPPGKTFRMYERFVDDYHLRSQADELAKHGDYNESLRFYKMAIKKNPDNYQARINLGISYFKLERYGEAETEYLGIIEDSRRGRAVPRETILQDRNNLSILYISTRRFKKARKQLEAILAADPVHVGARLNLALVLLDLREPALAEDEFKRILDIAPDHAVAHLWLGKIAESSGRPADADRHYRAALELRPDDTGISLDVVRHLAARPQYKDAVKKLLEDCIASHPDSAGIHIMLANFYLRYGDRKSAVKELETAFYLKPELKWIPTKIKELKSSASEADAVPPARRGKHR